MTSWFYQSESAEPIFSPGSLADEPQSFSKSTSTDSQHTPATSLQSQQPVPSTAGFASFICHVAYLENDLRRGDPSIFFDGHDVKTSSRVPAGEGAFYVVDKAKPQSTSGLADRPFVAIKTIKDQVL
jgi:hypothetical protein